MGPEYAVLHHGDIFPAFFHEVDAVYALIGRHVFHGVGPVYKAAADLLFKNAGPYVGPCGINGRSHAADAAADKMSLLFGKLIESL